MPELKGLPPRGGSGLKSMFAAVPDISSRLPPRGGSGLKLRGRFRGGCGRRSPSARREWIEMYLPYEYYYSTTVSPSARREWIEIDADIVTIKLALVSLREEGVD